ncbi:MAG: Na(+)-translocating NADH-quinone reductase subunit C [Pseudomonadales bacterium]
MSNDRDSMKNILVVALAVCFVCSVVVSSAAVLLKPQRLVNKQLDRNENILRAVGLYDDSGSAASISGDGAAGGNTAGKTIEELFQQFEVRLADLEEKRLLSPLEASDLGIDPATYEQRKAARDPTLSKPLGTGEDIASISRRARYSTVYILRQGNDIDSIVIPIHGYGLWSILYGYIALEGDLQTVRGITFYEHGETAGLGGEVDNPAWKALWTGKQIYADDQVALKVIKGNVNPASASAGYQIDGLSGATLTSRGVEYLIAYWLGDDGFGPILDKLRRG